MTQNNSINHTDLILHKTSATDVDFKSTGQTNIMTTPSGLVFILMGYGIVGSNVSVVIAPGTFNIGWTAAAYSDFVNGQTFSLTASGNFSTASQFDASAPEAPYVPANTTVKINVTLGTTATTASAKVFLYGFFIPDN